MKTLTFTNEGEVCEIIIMSVVPRRVEDTGRQNDREWLRCGLCRLIYKSRAIRPEGGSAIEVEDDHLLDGGHTSPRGPRIADLRYLGESSPSEVLNRIQPAMSKAGWQSTSLTGAAIKTLRYVKGREECVLVIHKKAVGGGTIIMVRVHPRSSG